MGCSAGTAPMRDNRADVIARPNEIYQIIIMAVARECDDPSAPYCNVEAVTLARNAAVFERLM